MVKIEMKSLSDPMKKGGIGQLLVIGGAIAVVGFIGMAGFNFLNNSASQLLAGTGLTSAFGLDAGGQFDGTEVVSTAGQLGVGSNPYSTVTFSQAVKDGAGTSYASISQYVWDEAPQNWGNPINISKDYTTPKGTSGQDIAIPSTSTITTGTMTATLSTALGETGTQVDAQGNMVVVNKDYYVHGAITGAPDLFFKVSVPSAGAVDTTTPTITLADRINPRLDTTAWTSSAIDLGATSGTAKEMSVITSYRILDANIAQVKYIEIQDLNKFGDDGSLDRITINFNGMEGGSWTPYDYTAGVDLTAYDGTTGFDAKLNGSDRVASGILGTINGGENVNLEVEVVDGEKEE